MYRDIDVTDPEGNVLEVEEVEPVEYTPFKPEQVASAEDEEEDEKDFDFEDEDDDLELSDEENDLLNALDKALGQKEDN